MVSSFYGASRRRFALASLLIVMGLACAEERPVRRVGVLFAAPRLADAARAIDRVLRETSEHRSWRVELVGLEPVGRDAIQEEAERLVGSGVDVIVAVTTSAALAARAAVKERGVPIVFCLVSDPISAGLVSDLARPGGNVTGVRDSGSFLAGKRLELLVRAHPGVRRVLVVDGGSPPSDAILRELRHAAPKLGVELLVVEARAPDDVEAVYRGIAPGEVDAVYVPSDAVIGMGEAALRNLVKRDGIPTIIGGNISATAVFGFGAPASESGAQAAALVAKILDGMPPGDLPVERPRNPRFRLFLGNAREIGYTFSETAYWLADELVHE